MRISEPHETELPLCETCGAVLRPHVCWFGEVPYQMDRIFAELAAQHAADDGRLVRRGRTRRQLCSSGTPQWRADDLCRPGRTRKSGFFDEVVLAKAGESLPLMVKELLAA